MDPRSFDKVLVIANPTSGSCTAHRWLGRVAAAFAEAGCRTETAVTERAGHARELAASHGSDNALLVAFGGDGTANEVLNGADFSRSALAVIPAGAGNVLAKELGMSRWPPKAVRQLLCGRVVRFNVGVCNGRRFACVFGAGVDAWVVRMVHERRRGGSTQWHYLPHLVCGLLSPVPWNLSVEVDGVPFAKDLDQVAVGNTHSYGGPIEMTPAASPRDGLFDVMGARRQGPAEMIGLAACGFLRAVHRTDLVCYGRGRRVCVSSSRSGVPCELDGDDAGVLPAEIVMQAAAARVLVPSGFRAAPRAIPDRA